MKILICGGRDFDDWALVHHTMQGVMKEFELPAREIIIIEGEAIGADFLGRVWAKWVGAKVEAYPAQWNKYGPKAGPLRNQQMLDEGEPDYVIALPGGHWTADMVRRSRSYGVEVKEI